MNFPKSILVIKYFPSYKNSEVPDYIPICITSVENAKEFFWEKEYELFEIFPEASRCDDNIPNVSPCQLDRNFAGNFCEDETCYLCRKKFWNQELDEKDSFMNF